MNVLWICINSLSASPTKVPVPQKCQSHKMVKHTQTICQQKPQKCLSVFGHFMGLVLKGLTITSVKAEFGRFHLTVCFTGDDNNWMMGSRFFFFSLASLYAFQLHVVLTETLLHEIDILLLLVLSNWLSLLPFSNWLSLLSFSNWLSLFSLAKWGLSNCLSLSFSTCLSLLLFSNWFSSKVISGTTWSSTKLFELNMDKASKSVVVLMDKAGSFHTNWCKIPEAWTWPILEFDKNLPSCYSM